MKDTLDIELEGSMRTSEIDMEREGEGGGEEEGHIYKAICTINIIKE